MGGTNLLCGNWNFLKQQMKEENTFEYFKQAWSIEQCNQLQLVKSQFVFFQSKV